MTLEIGVGKFSMKFLSFSIVCLCGLLGAWVSAQRSCLSESSYKSPELLSLRIEGDTLESGFVSWGSSVLGALKSISYSKIGSAVVKGVSINVIDNGFGEHFFEKNSSDLKGLPPSGFLIPVASLNVIVLGYRPSILGNQRPVRFVYVKKFISGFYLHARANSTTLAGGEA